jgi:glycosyltransferase involved in cell wall biosynthesis
MIKTSIIQNPTTSLHVVIIWQHFLPYHHARIRQTQQRLIDFGHRLTSIQVASRDASYGFGPDAQKGNVAHICCFPDSSYHDHTVLEIHRAVKQALATLQPDVVFAPATPFPEGMAAVNYRLQSGCRMVMMDDAWELTDTRGGITTLVKRLIHRNIDGVFIPAESHSAYYKQLCFPSERIVYGVDVVDNDFFAFGADVARNDAAVIRSASGLPEYYFLFVGRFLPRKGLKILLEAYRLYREQAGDIAWSLVLVGDGELWREVERLASEIGMVYCIGKRFSEELCRCYGLAEALIVPSESDPWGLVVNEGMAAGLPVIVSTGCGAAKTLVEEGANGWTFAPGDNGQLTEIMLRLTSMPEDKRREMGVRSRTIVTDWSLDRFADGVLQALELLRREPGGWLSALVARFWQGRVRIT